MFSKVRITVRICYSGVHPDLPVKGVSLLLGNDLAGDKVIVNPCMTNLQVHALTLTMGKNSADSK